MSKAEGEGVVGGESHDGASTTPTSAPPRPKRVAVLVDTTQTTTRCETHSKGNV